METLNLLCPNCERHDWIHLYDTYLAVVIKCRSCGQTARIWWSNLRVNVRSLGSIAESNADARRLIRRHM